MVIAVEVELEEVVEFLKNPEKFTRLGAKLPKVRAPVCCVFVCFAHVWLCDVGGCGCGWVEWCGGQCCVFARVHGYLAFMPTPRATSPPPTPPHTHTLVLHTTHHHTHNKRRRRRRERRERKRIIGEKKKKKKRRELNRVV